MRVAAHKENTSLPGGLWAAEAEFLLGTVQLNKEVSVKGEQGIGATGEPGTHTARGSHVQLALWFTSCRALSSTRGR